MTPAEVRSQRLEDQGRALAAEGIAQAAEGAERQAPGFADDATGFFLKYAKQANRPVSVTEARLSAIGVVPEVRDARAWGQIPRTLVKCGLIEHAGYAPSPSPTSHARPSSLWRWIGD